jgi:hypothetical protein
MKTSSTYSIQKANTSRNVTLECYLPVDLRRRATKYAKEQGFTLSKLVELAIKEEMARRAKIAQEVAHV